MNFDKLKFFVDDWGPPVWRGPEVRACLVYWIIQLWAGRRARIADRYYSQCHKIVSVRQVASQHFKV